MEFLETRDDGIHCSKLSQENIYDKEEIICRCYFVDMERIKGQKVNNWFLLVFVHIERLYMAVVIGGENQPRFFGGLSSSGLLPSLVPVGVEFQSPSLSSHPSSISTGGLIPL